MLYAWKFIIQGEPREVSPGVFARPSVAVVLGKDEESAKTRLHQWATEQGYDARWLSVASVRRLEIAENAVLTWAQGV